MQAPTVPPSPHHCTLAITFNPIAVAVAQVVAAMYGFRTCLCTSYAERKRERERERERGREGGRKLHKRYKTTGMVMFTLE